MYNIDKRENKRENQGLVMPLSIKTEYSKTNKFDSVYLFKKLHIK